MAAQAEVKTQIARLEGQLRHLTLPSQRGYRRMLQRKLESLGYSVAPPAPLSDADKAILDALRYASMRTYGPRDKPHAPWLYAAAASWDSRKADFDRWFVTGPTDRRGHIKGPFSREQIKRVVASGLLKVVCCDDEGEPIAYELAKGVIGIDA